MSAQIVILVSNRLIKAFRVGKHRVDEELVLSNEATAATEFRRYLQQIGRSPVRVVVNINEELLHFQKIPRIRGRDRQALIDRKIHHVAGGSEFTFVHSLGADPKNKNDERLLICGLADSETLTPWLQCLYDNRNPVLGIYSTPVIRESLCSLLQKCEHLLMVSTLRNREKGKVQVRQCYFLNGRLVLNRVDTKNDCTDIRSEIFREIGRSRNYLLRAHGLDPRLELQTWLITETPELDSTDQPHPELAKIDLNTLMVSELARKAGIEHTPDPIDFEVISAFQCVHRYRFKNHYQNRKFRYFRHHDVAAKCMRFASVAMLAGLACHGIWTWLQIQETRQTITATRENLIRVGRTAEQTPEVANLAGFTPVQVRSLMLADRTLGEKSVDPRDLLDPVSQGLSASPGLHLQKIEWQDTPLKSESANGPDNAANGMPGTDVTGPVNELGLIDTTVAATPEGRMMYLRIQGEVLPFQGDYADAHRQIDYFVATLKKHPRVKAAEAKKLPMDTRPDSDMSGELKIDEKKELSALFSVDIRLQFDTGQGTITAASTSTPRPPALSIIE